MDRISLKNAAKLSVQEARLSDSQPSPLIVTLVWFVALNLITAFYVQAANTTYFYPMMNDLMEGYTGGYTGSFVLRNSNYNPLVFLAAYLLMLLLSLFLSVGYTRYALNLSRSVGGAWRDLVCAFSFAGKLICLYLLMSIFVFLWMMLFIIPGIVASYRYSMAYYVLVDNPELSAREALNISKRLTQGHKLELFMLDLSFIGWHLVCALTMGILYIWKYPYIMCTYAHAYNWLLQQDSGAGPGYAPPVREYTGPEL